MVETAVDDKSERLLAALRAVIQEEMSRSPSLRALMVEMAHLILETNDGEHAAGRASEGSGSMSPDGADDSPGKATESGADTEIAPIAQRGHEVTGVAPLAIGGAVARVPVRGVAEELLAAQTAFQRPGAQRAGAEAIGQEADRADLDLRLIAERCALKARSCRVAVERRASLPGSAHEAEMIAKIDAMIAEAKSLPDCFLWAVYQREQPDDASLHRIALCYEAVGEAALLAAGVNDERLRPPEVVRAFEMLAEASSALRVALNGTWVRKPDADQEDAHVWLRRETRSRDIFVSRYMTIDDSADPGRASDLLAEVRGLTKQVDGRQATVQRVGSLLKRIEYHVRRLPAEGTGKEHDCQRINDAFEELMRLGVRSSDPRLRPATARMRYDAFPPSLRPHPAILESQSSPAPAPRNDADEDRSSVWSERVAAARTLLSGHRIVVIGGKRRQDAIERMVDAFDLAAVEWVELTEHGSGEPMRAPIRRPETGLVLALIKLCGHLHAEEARRYARDEGKPCVLAPAGYNPEQIAERVLEQADRRLAGQSVMPPG